MYSRKMKQINYYLAGKLRTFKVKPNCLERKCLFQSECTALIQNVSDCTVGQMIKCDIAEMYADRVQR